MSKPAKITHVNSTVSGNRSKAEQLVIDRLRFFLPRVEILKNDRILLKPQEVDVLIPSLKIAIEVSGPIHFRKIFSDETFSRTLESDERKAKKLEVLGYKLIVIKLPEKSDTYPVFLKEEIKNTVIPTILEWKKLNNML